MSGGTYPTCVFLVGVYMMKHASINPSAEIRSDAEHATLVDWVSTVPSNLPVDPQCYEKLHNSPGHRC